MHCRAQYSAEQNSSENQPLAAKVAEFKALNMLNDVNYAENYSFLQKRRRN